MFRSQRRYQKQVRDLLRRQELRAQGRYVGGLRGGMDSLTDEANRIKTEKARAAAELANAEAARRERRETLSEELARLGRLHTEGVLTADEFAAAKRRVLNRPT